MSVLYNLLNIFRYEDDLLPTERPWRQAVLIYAKQFQVFAFVTGNGVSLFSITLLININLESLSTFAAILSYILLLMSYTFLVIYNSRHLEILTQSVFKYEPTTKVRRSKTPQEFRYSENLALFVVSIYLLSTSIVVSIIFLPLLLVPSSLSIPSSLSVPSSGSNQVFIPSILDILFSLSFVGVFFLLQGVFIEIMKTIAITERLRNMTLADKERYYQEGRMSKPM